MVLWVLCASDGGAGSTAPAGVLVSRAGFRKTRGGSSGSAADERPVVMETGTERLIVFRRGTAE